MVIGADFNGHVDEGDEVLDRCVVKERNTERQICKKQEWVKGESRKNEYLWL